MDEFIPFAGMILSLLVVFIIAAAILLYPLSTRLGKLIELRIQERQEGMGAPSEAMDGIHRTLSELETQVRMLTERQQFVERLLESGDKERVQSDRGS
jgi:predicted phage tail protein